MNSPHRTPVDPTAEADAPLLPGWRHLEHITPRRPARTVRRDGGKPAPRGRRTWAITFLDPDLPPNHAAVTRSTGKLRQVDALEEAKRVNNRLRELLLDFKRGRKQPAYLRLAHVQRDARGDRKLISDAVSDVAAALPADSSARHCQDYGDHFAAYAHALGVLYLDQLSEELLLGWCRCVILEPSARNRVSEAKWYTTVDLWMRVLKTTLRTQLRWAPQLNSDILRRGLPRFGRKGGQSALLKALVAPTPEQRAWLLAPRQSRMPTGTDDDEGGKSLSQDTLYRLLHTALRYDCKQLRALMRGPEARARHVARVKLASVDLTALLLGGLRKREYAQLKREHVQLDRREPMDRHTRTDLIRVYGKGSRWRDVPLTGYTVIASALARAQVQGRKPNEYLSERTYSQLTVLLSNVLPEHGAPRCAVKDLRSTGCNYAQRLQHIQLETRAARWGHTVGVHTSYYLRLSGAALQPSPTLEDAMGCAGLMRRAVRLLQLRNALGIASRAHLRSVRVYRRKGKPAPEPALPAAAE